LDEVDARGLLISRRILDATPISHPKLRLVDCLAEDMYILPSASLISREAFDAVGGFDERLAGYEDDDLFLRMFRAGYQNIYVDEPLSQWRIHFSSSSYARKMSESRLIYFEKLCTEYPDDPDRDYFYVKNLIAPRFCRSLLGEYSRAIRTGSEERFSSAVRDLRIVSRRLRFKAAMIFAAILFLSRSTRAGANILMLSRLFGRLGFRTRLIS
jgi:hypothetical protein